MPRLIDADALKKEWKMGDVCETCDQDTRQCGNDYCFSRMDVCGMIDDAPTVATDTNVLNKWISVKDRLPAETHSIFWPWYGRKEWKNSMWREQSDKVLVTVTFKDGTRLVATGETHDGEWYTSISKTLNPIVTHWMPFPELPKEVKQE